jgi:hypothetical protein
MEGPLAKLVSSDTSSLVTHFHHIGIRLIVILVVMHVVAIVSYAVFKREDLVRPMVTGDKHGDDAKAASRDDVALRLRALVATMPIDYLLLETDAPDQPLANHRGQRNEPAYLTEVLDTVAALRGEPREAIAAATTRNAQGLFGLL